MLGSIARTGNIPVQTGQCVGGNLLLARYANRETEGRYSSFDSGETKEMAGYGASRGGREGVAARSSVDPKSHFEGH